MKTDLDRRELHSDGVQAKRTFAISLRNQAHIMAILRDTLYTDKILAVLREYSTNAWDAHQSVGKGDLPIDVTLPTPMEPTLVIRDYGPGMSEEEIFNIYTQYGESTKRGTNDENGMLGIGAKSGFAYSDTFTVTSWNGGTRRVYIAVLDESDVGEIQLVHEEPCGDETGVEIKVPVRPNDILDFERKASKLFTYFVPRPKINIEIPLMERSIREFGFFNTTESEIRGYGYNDSRGWVAVMGCIPYRINLDQLTTELEEVGVTKDTLKKLSGGLFFKIGEVQFNASREELKYTTVTKQALAAKFLALIDGYVEEFLEGLRDSKTSEWEKRLKTLDMMARLKVRIPDRFKSFTETEVPISFELPPDSTGYKTYQRPVTFTIHQDRSAETHIHVSQDTMLVIKDDQRPVDGFRLERRHYLIRPTAGKTIDEVTTELNEWVTRCQITGVKIRKLSDLPWSQWGHHGRVVRTPNQKHRVSTFKLMDTKRSFGFPWSANWEIEESEPTDQDVFVVLFQFQSVTDGNFYTQYQADREAAKTLGSSMPPIYGYKTTERAPIKVDETPGVPYETWRIGFLLGLLTPERMGIIQTLKWADVIPEEDWSAREFRRELSGVLKTAKRCLDGKHLMIQFLEKFHSGIKDMGKISAPIQEAIQHLLRSTGKAAQLDLEAPTMRDEVFKTYPLLRLNEGMSKLGGKQAADWFDYIQLVDRSKNLDHSPTGASKAPEITSDSTTLSEELAV